VKAKERISW